MSFFCCFRVSFEEEGRGEGGRGIFSLFLALYFIFPSSFLASRRAFVVALSYPVPVGVEERKGGVRAVLSLSLPFLFLFPSFRRK